MVQPGVWKGLLNARVGTFRFSHVEMVTEDTPRCQRRDRIHRRRNSQRSKPRNVEELMQRIGLEVTIEFLINYKSLLVTHTHLQNLYYFLFHFLTGVVGGQNYQQKNTINNYVGHTTTTLSQRLPCQLRLQSWSFRECGVLLHCFISRSTLTWSRNTYKSPIYGSNRNI